MKWYSDDSELAVRIQSRALEAVVIAHKWYRKLKLLNFVTFTVRTEPPRAAPTPGYTKKHNHALASPNLGEVARAASLARVTELCGAAFWRKNPFYRLF